VAELKAHIEAEHVEDSCGAGKKLTKLNINGKDYEVDIEPNWTLQRTLLYKIGLTGSTKKGCDHGACGTCTVIIDGRPVLGCTTLAIECVGKKIETIEGIAAAKHPLVASYVKNDVPQCGFCAPGFIATAKALLDRNSNPTADEVKQALAGNLCRCTTYYRHPKAVLEAAQMLRGGG
jgi:xanthine dehydrogenase YagT iron-sulfur-binding subunit